MKFIRICKSLLQHYEICAFILLIIRYREVNELAEYTLLVSNTARLQIYVFPILESESIHHTLTVDFSF